MSGSREDILSDSGAARSVQVDPETGEAGAPSPMAAVTAERWPKRRVVAVVAVVLVAMLAIGGCATFAVWSLMAGDSESMSAMRAFVQDDYPDYQIVDSTRSGYILRHKDYEALRLDVRFVREGMISVWD